MTLGQHESIRGGAEQLQILGGWLGVGYIWH